MNEYLRALEECLGNPIAVITNSQQWLIFMIIELITISFTLLLYKKRGRLTESGDVFRAIIAGMMIGYVIHFVAMVILIGTFYNGNSFMP